MTRKDAEVRVKKLQAQRDALVDQIADADVTSATISAGGGSKSYTNRSVDDLKKKVAFLDHEIAKLEARLGYRSHPGAIRHIFPRYV
ncbi:MAG: hypothetical protein IKC80_10010 [Kiritimatiellae bacterium]|nr:hypothetical protein [Kiritimatiellia bacterium]